MEIKSVPKNVATSPSKGDIDWQGWSLHENITLNQNQIFKTLQVICSVRRNLNTEILKRMIPECLRNEAI